jgi:hypothetical protein
MPLIWKGMKIDGERPQVGHGATLLGVRVGPGVNDDINPDEDGFVRPGQGGMSVSPSVDALPSHRLPCRLRLAYPARFPDADGPNNLFCWSMGNGAFAEDQVAAHLRLRLDPDNPEKHGFVEPDDKMMLADYEAALAATRDQWQKWEE